eukprot:15017-Heterococcus_DN1.PRE.4
MYTESAEFVFICELAGCGAIFCNTVLSSNCTSACNLLRTLLQRNAGKIQANIGVSLFLLGDTRALEHSSSTMDNNEQQQYVKLISAEKAEFWVDRDCVMISGTIKAMLSGSFAESKGEISFAEIRTVILEKVIQYMYYKVRYTNSKVRTPEFNIEPELALELLMAANFLDC